MADSPKKKWVSAVSREFTGSDDVSHYYEHDLCGDGWDAPPSVVTKFTQLAGSLEQPE